MPKKSGKIRLILPYAAFAFVLAGACMLLGRAALDRVNLPPVPSSAEVEDDIPVPLLVIDPGHGGEDGGAAVGETLEKDLNLAVSEKVCDLCTIFGYPVQMTRTEDVLLYDYYHDLDDYKGKQKTYDLKNRLRITEESGAAVLLSIHMNLFPQSRYRGLQVYYSPNAESSKSLANRIQLSARQRLDPENTREIKAATNAIYLLKRAEIPAVLVECGFLSNPDERELLQTPDYQLRLAASLFVPSAEFLTVGQ